MKNNKKITDKFINGFCRIYNDYEKGKIKQYEMLLKLKMLVHRLRKDEYRMHQDTWDTAIEYLMQSTICGEMKTFEEHYKETYEN